MTEDQEKLKHAIIEKLPYRCSAEFSNSTYSDEIPEYARRFMGLRILPPNEDNK